MVLEWTMATQSPTPATAMWDTVPGQARLFRANTLPCKRLFILHFC